MKWKFGEGFATITSHEAKAEYPQLLIQFLESRLIWVRNFGKVVFIERNEIEETEDPMGNPVEITCMYSVYCIHISNKFYGTIYEVLCYFYIFLDATMVTGCLLYWVVWERDQAKFVEAEEAGIRWPNLVIEFLEKNLKIE